MQEKLENKGYLIFCFLRTKNLNPLYLNATNHSTIGNSSNLSFWSDRDCVIFGEWIGDAPAGELIATGFDCSIIIH